MPESFTFNLDDTLDAVLRGNADAFLEIERAHGPGLRAFLASQLFHVDEVDDLAQETMITAYRKLHTFRRHEDFGAWLRGIARNKLLQHFERHSRRSALMETFRLQSATLMASELEDAAARTRLHHLQAMLTCISKLPDKMRQVVRTTLEGGKPASLAAELEMSTRAIYQLQHRAIKLLRECTTRETAAHG
ncbi:MAG TPA: sigma-70 family RNA polymerase sigma factor [Prosthecobacter sp.]